MSWIVRHAISDASPDRIAGFTETATTAVVGRKNYEGFAGYWLSVADGETADASDRTFSRWFTTVGKVAFPSTLTEAGPPNSTLTAHPPAKVVADLRRQPGGDIRHLLAAGEVDRLSIMLCPETVGGGARLFDDGVLAPAAWTLALHQVTETGSIVLDHDRAR